tara:strand:+ start:24626 stop:26281 length:1656 start_codon:yes stop_codon:yes gene_type:complete
MHDLKIYVSSSLITEVEMKPIISGKFVAKKIDSCSDYLFEPSDSFKFNRKADFDALVLHKNLECDPISVVVKKIDSGLEVVVFTGTFTFFNCSPVNYSKCFLEVKPDAFDKYYCFNEAKKEVVNVFTAGSTKVSKGSPTGAYETITCSGLNTSAYISDYNYADTTPLASCLSGSSDWCVKENEVLIDGNNYGGVLIPSSVSEPFTLEQNTIWHRQVVTTVGSGVPNYAEPSEWSLLSTDAGAGTSTWWKCPGPLVLGDYRHGRLLSDVLEYAITSLNCDLTLKSDFFGVNGNNSNPINKAYIFAAAKCKNITIHQKSDVKRKNSTNPSSSNAWGFKIEDFLVDLFLIFNLAYKIDNGVFTLEHVSFFGSAGTTDLSDNKNIEFETDNSGNEDIKKEYFFWPEKNSLAFDAEPIVYNCGKESKEHRCTLLHTDMGYIENPVNAERVADEGFILISNSLISTELVLNEYAFSWSTLLLNLHSYNRLFKAGFINNTFMTFDSFKPYIQAKEFLLIKNWLDFNVDHKIKTSFGIGEIETAKVNLFTNKINLILKY